MHFSHQLHDICMSCADKAQTLADKSRECWGGRVPLVASYHRAVREGLHDLRRTVATGLQRLGVRLEVTEAVLNHISGSRAGIRGGLSAP